MKTLLAIPVFIVAILLQTTIFSKIHLLSGTIDLILLVLLGWTIHASASESWQWAVVAGLFMGYVSKLPFLYYVPAYLLVVGIALFLRSRFWQAPLLVMVISAILGTIIVQVGSFVMIQLDGAPFQPLRALEYVIFPSVLLNLIGSLPLYGIMLDIAQWFGPTVRINESD